ncbi:hypothetical protein RJ641_024260 [Dillenia turbinata]|uniref:Uncharacterized protein n=1 Tax=Dillenia turbinata TaxID=194707 RepID=A0AAN8YTJ5_9MAGN
MSSSEESGGAVPGNKFHLCKRVTRVHNLSGVDLLWLPHRKFTPHRKGTPLNDRRQQISPGNYMDTHFGYYKTNIPEVSINVHVSPMIENCEKENEVVLTKDEIREASEIKLFCDDKGIIRHTIDKRADFPKGFRCCFFARINKVIQTSNTDRSELPNKKEGEKKEHHVEAAAKAPGDLNLGDAQSFDPPLVGECERT